MPKLTMLVVDPRSAGRHGTFVSAHGDPAHRQAQKAAAAFADQISNLELGKEEAVALVIAALGKG